jgi:hypothetical protein
LDEDPQSLSDKEDISPSIPLDDLGENGGKNGKSKKDGKKKRALLPHIGSIGEAMQKMEEKIGHGMEEMRKDVKLVLASGR